MYSGNEIANELANAARRRIETTKKLTGRASILVALAAAGWLVATASNNNFIPAIRICFRAPSSTSPKSQAYLACESRLNVRTISKGSHQHALRDIDYSAHIAKRGTLGDFNDSNLSTQVILALSAMSAFGALAMSVKAKQMFEEERSLFLSSKVQEYLHHQILVEASSAQIESAVNPASDAGIQIAIAQHQLQLMQLSAETARLDAERARFQQVKDGYLGRNVTPSAIDTMKRLLQEHEDGWLYKVLSSVKPIVVYGSFGTGKTSTMISIGLVREALGFPVEQAVDLYGNGKNSRLWDYFSTTNSSTVIHIKSEILDYLDQAPLDWTVRANNPGDRKQLLIDEFTNYSVTHVDELSERLAKKYKNNEATAEMVVQRFTREALQGLRHAGISACLVSHDMTAKTWGKNSHAMRQAGFIVIQKFSESGEAPLPRVVVNGIHDQKGELILDKEATLPEWFFPETIARHLSGTKLIDS